MIHHYTNELLLTYLKEGMNIVEFGNNGVNINQDVTAMNHPNGTGGVLGTVSLEYYPKNYGVNQISLDLNGYNGARKTNLSRPVRDEDLKGWADIVTDLGTSEHVPNLYAALKNAFNFCKVGGLMIHANPLTGSFQGHGHHYFTPGFWKAFAKAAKLKLVETREQQAYAPREDNDGWEVYAVLKKQKSSKFPVKSAFDKLYAEYVFSE